MTISEWALREGIVLDAIGRHDPDDWSDDPRAIRRASVQGLARRCTWHEAHSRHVAALALELFDQTQRAARARRRRPRDARVRARCCTTSASTSRARATTGTRRTSSSTGSSAASRPTRSQLLAALVRWHRRGEPKATDELARSTTSDRLRRARRAAAARRRPRPRPRAASSSSVDVRVGPSLVVVRVHARGDAELELWGARRKRELFEKVFDRDLELVVAQRRDDVDVR